MLTSSITTYFVNNDEQDSLQQEKLDKIMGELEKIKTQNIELKKEIILKIKINKKIENCSINTVIFNLFLLKYFL